MFDTTIHKHESKVVAVTKEIEKSFSPDKVTEMYDKVRAQAEKDIITSLRVENNAFTGVVVQIQDSLSDKTSRLHLRFVLNGVEYYDCETLPNDIALSFEGMYDKLRSFFLEIIQRNIFKDAAPLFVKAFRK